MADKLKVFLLLLAMAGVCVWLGFSQAPYKLPVVTGIGIAACIGIFGSIRIKNSEKAQKERTELIWIVGVSSLAAFGLVYSLPPYELFSAVIAALAFFLLLYFLLVPKKAKN